MELRTLGSLKVSVVGLGTNNFGRKLDSGATARVLDACADAGINFIDTAEVYGEGKSEEYIGAAIAGRRDRFVIATKFRPGGTRRHIREMAEQSLRRLRTDRIDLYQIHFPDKDLAVEETVAELDSLVREGKVVEIGNSNFAGWQIADADWIPNTQGFARFASAQNRYSLLDRDAEREVVPACERFALGLIPYSPLANGLLTGKYRRDEAPPSGARLSEPRLKPFLTPDKFDVIEALEDYARERGVSLLEVAVGGLAAMPAVASVIAGATSPEQVDANAKAGEWKPGGEDLEALKAALAAARERQAAAA